MCVCMFVWCPRCQWDHHFCCLLLAHPLNGGQAASSGCGKYKYKYKYKYNVCVYVCVCVCVCMHINIDFALCHKLENTIKCKLIFD